MKTLKSLIFLMVVVSTLAFYGCDSSKDSSDNNTDYTVVILKFKAQPEQGETAVEELKKLFENVKEEPHFVSIKLHVDPKDDTNILLYEKWEDENYYMNEHMSTPHLQAFMENSANFLMGPPDVTFWKMINEVK